MIELGIKLEHQSGMEEHPKKRPTPQKGPQSYPRPGDSPTEKQADIEV